MATFKGFHILLGVCIVVSTMWQTSANPLPAENIRQNVTSNNASLVQQQTESADKDRVMYSYAEATVDSSSVPVVRQLTIVKGKDGETRFAKNENGTVQTGKWNGPIPAGPDANSYASKMVVDSMNTVKNEVLEPLTKINQQISSSLQDYMQLFNIF